MQEPRFQQCDFHTHTELSGEEQAKGFTLEKLFQTADGLDMRYVGYSEHWHADTPPDLFLRIREEIARLQPRYRTRVFLSAEIDVLNSRGDLSCDLSEAEKALDYVSVAIGHYRAPGAEQLRPDRVEDTVAMIEAVCRISSVTMLMHPSIVFDLKPEDLDHAVAPDVYDEVMKIVATHGKVVDYSGFIFEEYLRGRGFADGTLAIARESLGNFTRALVRHGVRLAPGSDAHNVFLWDGVTRWFGNNEGSFELLKANGYVDDQLWYFENRCSGR